MMALAQMSDSNSLFIVVVLLCCVSRLMATKLTFYFKQTKFIGRKVHKRPRTDTRHHLAPRESAPTPGKADFFVSFRPMRLSVSAERELQTGRNGMPFRPKGYRQEAFCDCDVNCA